MKNALKSLRNTLTLLIKRMEAVNNVKINDNHTFGVLVLRAAKLAVFRPKMCNNYPI